MAKANTITCPECGGDGADLEDSSEDCWKCGGTGVVAAPKPKPDEQAT